MSCLTYDELDRMLIKSISEITGISEKNVGSLSLEKIEKELDIRFAEPKIYFEWEKLEKTGWQSTHLKFVDDKIIKNRETAVKKYLKENL